ncbi:uncharacterized protein DEA37_0005932 [Paragonimus westermani]|uniref:Uncharacterized protein n=1 Tax=Paragonimus westermani TaxID=34504 RepID=A0A5J4NUC6_9TREM|nr:uncharacterized protein DEA37_0005932 [Paragonimus westermani]
MTADALVAALTLKPMYDQDIIEISMDCVLLTVELSQLEQDMFQNGHSLLIEDLDSAGVPGEFIEGDDPITDEIVRGCECWRWPECVSNCTIKTPNVTIGSRSLAGGALATSEHVVSNPALSPTKPHTARSWVSSKCLSNSLNVGNSPLHTDRIQKVMSQPAFDVVMPVFDFTGFLVVACTSVMMTHLVKRARAYTPTLVLARR